MRAAVVRLRPMARQIQSYASSKLRAQSMRSSTVSSTRVRGGMSAGCRACCSDRDRWMTTPGIWPTRSGLLLVRHRDMDDRAGPSSKPHSFGGSLWLSTASRPGSEQHGPQLGLARGPPGEGRVDPAMHVLPAPCAHLIANALGGQARGRQPGRTVMTPPWPSSRRRTRAAVRSACHQRPATQASRGHTPTVGPVDNVPGMSALWTAPPLSSPWDRLRPNRRQHGPAVVRRR